MGDICPSHPDFILYIYQFHFKTQSVVNVSPHIEIIYLISTRILTVDLAIIIAIQCSNQIQVLIIMNMKIIIYIYELLFLT